MLLLPQNAVAELLCPRLQELSDFFCPLEVKAETGTPFSILIYGVGRDIRVTVAGSGWRRTARCRHSCCRQARHGCCNLALLTSSPYLPQQHLRKQRGKAAASRHEQAQKSVGKNTNPFWSLNIVFLNKKDLYCGAFFLL